MFNMINQLSNNHKGILMMLGGFVLLFHTLGIIQTGLNLIIIVGSIFLIICGFFKAEYNKRLFQLLQTTQKNNQNKP